MVFGALMLSVLLLILANRDLGRPALFGRSGPNPWLNRMVFAVGVMVAAVLGIPWLQQVMGTVWPGVAGLMAGVALLGICSLWLELLRRLSQHSLIK